MLITGHAENGFERNLDLSHFQEFARQIALSATLICCTFLLCTSPVHSQSWRFGPEVAVGYEYDDNAELTIRTDDVVELNGILAEASVDVDYLSETTKFSFDPLVRRRNYPGDEEFNATEIDARLRYEYEGLKSGWRIDGRYNRAPVRNAERVDQDFDSTDPDDIPDDDTGLVQFGGNRERLSIRPSWSYRWTDVSSTSVKINYRDVSYDETFVFLVPYTDTTVLGDYRRRLSQKSTGFIEGSLRRYDGDDDTEFDTFGIGIGFESQLTPKIQMHTRVGAERVESPLTGISETRPVGDLTFIRRLETIRLLAQYRRSVSSTGSGNMSERDSININFTRDLTERFGAGLGVRSYLNKPIILSGGTGPGFERRFLQLTGLFTWNITKSLSLRTSYRYTVSNREVQGESANSNQFTWNITKSLSLRTSYRYTVSNREVQGESANSNQIVAWLIFRPSGIIDER
jgi:hypothetical protein